MHSLYLMVIISDSSFVFCKVYKGLKSTFAYALIAFTFLDCFQFFASSFIIVYIDGQSE